MKQEEVIAKGFVFDQDIGMISHYFDWASTTPISEGALAVYQETARAYTGNPSSPHFLGRKAAEFLSTQRSITADLLHVHPSQIIYTSGATESNGIIMQSLLWKRKPGKILFSVVEHDSLLQYRKVLSDKGFRVSTISAPSGYVDSQDLQDLLSIDTQLVSIMLVQNVVGTVQRLKELIDIIRTYEKKRGRPIHIHCDAVQAIGKIPFDIRVFDVDSASFSAHKFCGPRGIGILYLKKPLIESLSLGGGQEGGIRPGTEHVAAIAAMNRALEEELSSFEGSYKQVKSLRSMFEKAISPSSDFSLISPSIQSDAPIAPSICAFSVARIPSEVMMRVLSDQGYALSTGSACSHNAKNRKQSLFTLIGCTHKEALSSLRISFSPNTSIEEMEGFIKTLTNIAQEFSTILTRKN